MMGATITFLAVGLGDLVAGGLGGTPVNRPRALLGISAAAVVVVAAGSVAGWTAALATMSLVVVAAVAAWILLRVPPRPDGRRAWVALGSLVVALGGGVGGEGLWRKASVDWVADWLETLAFPALNMMEGATLFLVTAMFVFLSATTNGVVRAVLIAAGTRTESSEERLRGGRVIGVLERWMIFALMLSGEPTAAGLVVSAKSILRFPELNRAASHPPSGGDSPPAEVDQVTEYFLLGSLVSWLVAAIMALLFVGPF